MKNRRIHVVHVAGGLKTGGAEAMLNKLVAGSRDLPLRHSVISMTDAGRFGDDLLANGADLHCLGMTRSLNSLMALWQCRRLLQELEPGLVQGWMYYGNLMASLCVPSSIPVLWNVRHSLQDIRLESRSVRLVLWASRFFAPRCNAIVYNANASLEQHREYGLRNPNEVVLPNGFDTQLYRPDPNARNRLRQELGIPEGHSLIGTVARNHPMKDYAGLIAAASRLAMQRDDIHWCCIGLNVDSTHAPFSALPAGLRDRMHLLGERRDIPALMPAFDIYCQASAWGEGFPNVVGEAMACGVPAVATDVGDSGQVIGDTGRLVPPRDPKALAQACLELLELRERTELREQARQRIVDHYSLSAVCAQYLDLYQTRREHA